MYIRDKINGMKVSIVKKKYLYSTVEIVAIACRYQRWISFEIFRQSSFSVAWNVAIVSSTDCTIVPGTCSTDYILEMQRSITNTEKIIKRSSTITKTFEHSIPLFVISENDHLVQVPPTIRNPRWIIVSIAPNRVRWKCLRGHVDTPRRRFHLCIATNTGHLVEYVLVDKPLSHFGIFPNAG